MKNKVLVIVGGSRRKIEPFLDAADKVGVAVDTASFSELWYSSSAPSEIMIGDKCAADYDLIYFRMVGKRLEQATLLANYAKLKGISIIDHVYEDALLMPSTISKAFEMQKLMQEGIPFPVTIFGSLEEIAKRAGQVIGFPYVLKGTFGKKARDVWLIRSEDEESAKIEELKEREAKGESFFAQEFVKASQRIRVMVIGDRAVAGFVRPTKWRKTFAEKIDGEYPEGVKQALDPVPEKLAKLAIDAARAADLTISGVDILTEDNTERMLVIEANAAPAWNLINKGSGIVAEEEILKYFKKLLEEK